MPRYRYLVFVLLFALSWSPALAQTSCELGTDDTYLDINNVRARILNNGALFYSGGPWVYEVPKGSGIQAIFAANLWVAGLVNGELRAASSNYGGREFWPGPLGADGNPPTDCAPYDRLYNVSVRDLLLYDELGLLTDDLRDWPVHLGAPVINGDGVPGNYNLAGGDRPEILGHQTVWWIMHDLGGEHPHSDVPPLGLEVEGSAFAVASDVEALDNTTFYRYKLRYRGSAPLDSAYVALFVDPDLGNYDDDYAGADTTLGMGYVYNADNDDENWDSGTSPPTYGIAPPALGVDFMQGPMAMLDGEDNDRDGQIDEPGERLQMTAFVFKNNVEDGYGGEVLHNHIRGRWFNGEPIRDGCVPWAGCASEASRDTTGIMVPGDPVTGQLWSEFNYRQGNANVSGDRTMLISSGPFFMQPGDEQEVVIAVVWARGQDHLDSITQLREADRVVQAAWDDGLVVAPPPAPALSPPSSAPDPVVPANGATGQPRALMLRWEASPGAEAYLMDLARDPAFTTGSTVLISTNTVPGNGARRASGTAVYVDTLAAHTTYYWRLRGLNNTGLGLSTPVQQFTTAGATLGHGDILRLASGKPAIVEVAGPSGVEPCAPSAVDMDGCDEVGGNLVAESLNSTGDYVLGHLGSIESWIARFAPHDFEIRFTESGSFALNDLYNRASWVPFELWDIGSTGPYRVNDPADDVQLIPVISVWDSDDLCNFIYGLASTSAPLGLDWEGTATIHAEYPSTSYADWEAVAAPLVETDPADCPTIENGQVFRTWDRLFPLANLKFYGNPDGPNYRPEGPPAGTIIRFYTTSYGVSPPIPAAPGDGMAGVLQPLMLWWNAPTDERDTFLESHVQVAADSDFSTLVMQDSLESDHTTVVGLAHGSTYYWRVRSREQLGLFSDWSEAWSFAVGGAVAVEGGTPGIPARYELAANHPNPFNPTTTIRFALPQAGRARLTVFDVLGRRVATLVDEALAPGWHDVQWNASGWPSGLYFYRLEAGAFRETKSMLLVK